MIQVNMKNIEEPMQSNNVLALLQSKPGEFTWTRAMLAPNEFISHEDSIGLFESEPEPIKFFSLEQTTTPSIIPALKETDGFSKASIVYEIALSNQKFEHERKFYTLMILIGDLGGFQGAIIILPAFLMSFYAPKMFEASLLS